MNFWDAHIRMRRAAEDLRLVLDAAACDAEDGTIDAAMLAAVEGAVTEYKTAAGLVDISVRTAQ